MIQFTILNKKGFPKEKLDRSQCLVKGEPKKAGDVIEFDMEDYQDFQAANNLVICGFAKPANDVSAKAYNQALVRNVSKINK